MYRAPVSEIAFTLKHVAGLGEALAAGAFPDLTEDLVDAVLAEAGRFASRRDGAARTASAIATGVKLADGAVTTAPGWREVYRDWTARRLERHRRAGGSRRAGAADPALRRHAGDVERRLHVLRALPACSPWARSRRSNSTAPMR